MASGAKPNDAASGPMMGMETVAMPVLEGIKKDSAKYRAYESGANTEADTPASGDGHEHGDTAGNGDNERDRNQVGASVQDSIDEFFLLHTGNLANDNRHREEPDAAFGKVPLAKRQAGQKRAPCSAEVIARGADIK